MFLTPLYSTQLVFLVWCDYVYRSSFIIQEASQQGGKVNVVNIIVTSKPDNFRLKFPFSRQTKNMFIIIIQNQNTVLPLILTECPTNIRGICSSSTETSGNHKEFLNFFLKLSTYVRTICRLSSKVSDFPRYWIVQNSVRKDCTINRIFHSLHQPLQKTIIMKSSLVKIKRVCTFWFQTTRTFIKNYSIIKVGCCVCLGLFNFDTKYEKYEINLFWGYRGI